MLEITEEADAAKSKITQEGRCIDQRHELIRVTNRQRSISRFVRVTRVVRRDVHRVQSATGRIEVAKNTRAAFVAIDSDIEHFDAVVVFVHRADDHFARIATIFNTATGLLKSDLNAHGNVGDVSVFLKATEYVVFTKRILNLREAYGIKNGRRVCLQNNCRDR